MVASSEIHIVGYPRSGTVWLTRLMSDLLDSPIVGATDKEIVGFDFCQTGKGGCVIYKTHLMTHEWEGTPRTVFIQRDPRDVAVSAAHYLNIPLWDVLRNMCIESNAPFDKTWHIYHVQGAYADFVNGWLDSTEWKKTFAIQYEWLHEYSYATLAALAYHVADKSVLDLDVTATLDRQHFNRHKDKYPHSMRKGIVGDWRNHFDRKHGEMITGHLGELMLNQGYIEDLDWWKELE